MPTWKHFELGAKVRTLAGGGEERIALDRLTGKPVALRLYPRPREGAVLPDPIAAPAPQLAQPLELTWEQGEAIVARELAFGPSIEDLLALGPQPALVVSSLVRQLLEGLAKLHAAGRCHLRLSPSAFRFDLLAGLLKIADLEQALLDAEVPTELIPRYLEPEIRSGPGGPVNDIYSVGRIGEALLRGGAPLGPWGQGAGAPGPIWDFLQRCQSPIAAERPPNAGEALAQLERLGLPQAPALTLPLGGFVRRHVRALRELRRWRAQPLPPGSPPDGRSYRELLSSSQASRLWAAIGAAALVFMAGTFALAQAPERRGEVLTGYPSDTCRDDARPQTLAPGASVPEGRVGIEVSPQGSEAGSQGSPNPEDETVAVDGCALRGELGKPLSLAVPRGTHEFRALTGAGSVSRSLEVHQGEKVVLDVDAQPPVGSSDAARSLVQRIEQSGGGVNSGLDAFDPIEIGMLDPLSRDLLGADRAVFGSGTDAGSDVPMGLGLALDGLRAARRRFDAAGTVCAAGLATAAAKELASGTDDSERALQLAVELLTITRIRGPELREPLRTEREALERLQIEPNRRLLSAVEQLSVRPDIANCLADLAPRAAQVNELSALVIGQLPGMRLPDESAGDDDSTQ